MASRELLSGKPRELLRRCQAERTVVEMVSRENCCGDSKSRELLWRWQVENCCGDDKPRTVAEMASRENCCGDDKPREMLWRLQAKRTVVEMASRENC